MKDQKILQTVNILFAGDSGDGMQLAGSQLTRSVSLAGNDIHTYPDFPAEIRAPAGTLAGVSGFHLTFSSDNVHATGDDVDVLLAMNPAALRVYLSRLKKGGFLIVNSDLFTARECQKAGFAENPLESEHFAEYQLFSVPLNELTKKALASENIAASLTKKSKNLFGLGIVFWLFDQNPEKVYPWIETKFKEDPELHRANMLAFKAGFSYAEASELFLSQYHVHPAILPQGTYRQITGNEAIGLALAALSTIHRRPILVSAYPITPASSILQQAAHLARFGIQAVQAEDEIASISMAIGAAYAGNIAITCTSGPGFDLKSEALGYAVMTEMPLVVIDVQRAGPSTGMPTKSEQTDLLMALYGRHGECPVPVLAAQSPSDCFAIMIEACDIAVRYMTPVIVLSEASLANGAEPFLIPDLSSFLSKEVGEMNSAKPAARPWITPGFKGKMFRTGGLERDAQSGEISYDAENHHNRVKHRHEKVQGIAKEYRPLTVEGDSDTLVISWGSTYGSVRTAIEACEKKGISLAHLHLRYLNPLPLDLKNILTQFKKIIIPELNLGQLAKHLRSYYNVEVVSYTRVTGKPFAVNELTKFFLENVGAKTTCPSIS